MFAKLFVFFSFLLLFGCGSNPSGSKYEIAIDPSWYPLNLGEREKSIVGFSTELLTEIANQEDLSFSLLQTNWDSLFEGLQKEKYDAILSSLYPYNFNENLYSFSAPFLKTGPVLVLPIDSSHKSLKDLSSKAIGALEGSPEILLLEKDPTLLIRTYENVPTTLNALVAGQIEAAILPILLAETYVENLYGKKLKIESKNPLTDEGLRLITLKGKKPKLIKQFNKALHHLEKNGEHEKLLSKWNLSN